MINVPFDFNPNRTERKTGPFEIPPGEYALIKPISLVADLTIDAVVAIERLVYQGSDPATSIGSKFTNDTDKILAGTVYQNGDGSHAMAIIGAGGAIFPAPHPYTGAPQSSALNEAINVVLYPGDSINCINADGISRAITWQLSALNPRSYDYGIWVKSGTDIDGTAYTAEIFKNKT